MEEHKNEHICSCGDHHEDKKAANRKRVTIGTCAAVLGPFLIHAILHLAVHIGLAAFAASAMTSEMTIGTIVLVVLIGVLSISFVFFRVEVNADSRTCKKCGYEFVPTCSGHALAGKHVHIMSSIKCPSCGKKSSVMHKIRFKNPFKRKK